jgi:hypothetical protein
LVESGKARAGYPDSAYVLHMVYVKHYNIL